MIASNQGARDFVQWNDSVILAANETEDCLEALPAFGFEALDDQRYLAALLKRFFVYLRIAEQARGQQVEQAFSDNLFKELELSSLSRIRQAKLLVLGDRVLLRPACESVTIYVRAVVVPEGESLCKAYAKHLAAIPILAREGLLEEFSNFGQKPAARRYIFQTALILAHIYSDIVTPRDAGFTNRLTEAIARQPQRDHHSGLAPRSAMSAKDEADLHDAVIPLHSGVSRFLSSSSRSSQPVVITDVHSGIHSTIVVDAEELDVRATAILAARLRYMGRARSIAGGGER